MSLCAVQYHTGIKSWLSGFVHIYITPPHHWVAHLMQCTSFQWHSILKPLFCFLLFFFVFVFFVCFLSSFCHPSATAEHLGIEFMGMDRFFLRSVQTYRRTRSLSLSFFLDSCQLLSRYWRDHTAITFTGNILTVISPKRVPPKHMWQLCLCTGQPFTCIPGNSRLCDLYSRPPASP